MEMPDNMNIIEGDIFTTAAQYIIHQCNCETRYCGGLAASIFRRYPYANVYTHRTSKGWYDVPGTISVKGGTSQVRGVINLFGQRHSSLPNSSDDTYDMRLHWFTCAMKAVATIPGITSVALPEIGCGLAGGNWSDYFDLLCSWASKHSDIAVTIYRYDPDKERRDRQVKRKRSLSYIE